MQESERPQTVEMLNDGLQASVRQMLDQRGIPYKLVCIEGLTARHYSRKYGIPRGAGVPPLGSDSCIFLDGEPCWLV